MEENHSLIYVPEDDNRFCREAALEDINILKRKDALAAYQSDVDEIEDTTTASPQYGKLSCTTEPGEEKHQRYRKGRCFCCNDCPTDWSYVELYSEHYRCAGRNNLPITRHEINLGTVACGEEICYPPDGALSDMAGFERQNVQHPQLPREVPRADQS